MYHIKYSIEEQVCFIVGSSHNWEVLGFLGWVSSSEQLRATVKEVWRLSGFSVRESKASKAGAGSGHNGGYTAASYGVLYKMIGLIYAYVLRKYVFLCFRRQYSTLILFDVLACAGSLILAYELCFINGISLLMDYFMGIIYGHLLNCRFIFMSSY